MTKSKQPESNQTMCVISTSDIEEKMNYKKLTIFILLSVVIVLSSLEFGVFWDSVLFVSKMGIPLFENGFYNWQSIPLESDPGHPPFLASYMAVGWSIFGKSLAVSHWMMLPFIFGLLWQLLAFVSFFVKEKIAQIAAFVLVVADPTLLSQLVLVNFEVLQLFFFFVAINGILYNKSWLKVLGLALLGLVSLRGMMLCAGVFLIDFFIHLYYYRKSLKSFFTIQMVLEYSFASLPAAIYIVWRLMVKGWIISNPLQLWGSAWEYDSVADFFKNFARNIVVLGHQITDFGRVIPVLFVISTLFVKRKSLQWKPFLPVVITILFSTSVIMIVSLLINNTMGHRYFIPVYLAVNLLAFMLIHQFKQYKLVYAGLLCALLFGNFIVYPDKFSQGWDSSLAHVPYWGLRRDAIKYLDENEIPIAETATFFPNSTTIDNVELNGDLRSFPYFTGEQPYVLYSNVYNLTDEEFDLINKKYRIIKTFNKYNIRVELMKMRD